MLSAPQHTVCSPPTPGVLTLSLRTDQAGRGVAEGAQHGSDGQAQVLVAGVQRDGGEAQVRQAGSFLGANFDMRDLAGEMADI